MFWLIPYSIPKTLSELAAMAAERRRTPTQTKGRNQFWLGNDLNKFFIYRFITETKIDPLSDVITGDHKVNFAIAFDFDLSVKANCSAITRGLIHDKVLWLYLFNISRLWGMIEKVCIQIFDHIVYPLIVNLKSKITTFSANPIDWNVKWYLQLIKNHFTRFHQFCKNLMSDFGWIGFTTCQLL